MNAPAGGRVPPHDNDAERAVLASCLLDPESLAVAREVLPGDAPWWYRDAHHEIWKAMLEVEAAGSRVEQITLRGHLAMTPNRLERVGGEEYLLGLVDVIPTADQTEMYARRVRDVAALRAVIHAAHSVAGEAYAGVENVGDFLDRAERGLADACELRTPTSAAIPIGEVVDDAVAQTIAASRSGDHVVGHPTGLRGLDRMLSGLARGDLIVVAGRPGHGKTSLADGFAVNVARATSLPVLFFSYEMPARQLGLRMIASEGRIDLQKLRTGRVTNEDLGAIRATALTLSSLPIEIIDNARLTIGDVRREVRRAHREHGDVGAVIIDYAQLVRPTPTTKRRSREEEVAEISRESKWLAKEMNCPVVLLAQLNRQVEQRGLNAVPKLSDLRESGAIEQDADVVIFVHRPELVNPNDENSGVALVIVDKHRQGPTGTEKMRFMREFTRFENLEEYRRPS